MNELLTMSVLEMARRIRAKELSPVELVDVHIKRIEQVNQKINAVVVPTFDQAREQAKKAAERLVGNTDDLPPLFGVPCTIKDTFGVKGLPWAAGVVARKNFIANEDATVVKRIKAAGAIIMGKTNVPEAAMWCETYNKVYGRSKNPHDTTRTTGGSSGGEGAIIGAAASPFGPGSDIGGSIRYPCCFNGVVGHKPTGSTIPSTGHWPPAPGETAKYMSAGPMGRRLDDVIALLKIFRGPDGIDPMTTNVPLGDPYSVKPRKMKAYYFFDNGIWAPDHDVKLAVRKSVDALEDAGVQVEPWLPPGINRGLKIWSAMLALGGGETFESLVGCGKSVNPWKELAKLLVGRSDYTLPILGVIAIEKFTKNATEKLMPMYEKGKKLQRDIEEKLGPDGVLVCPPFPRPAPKHGWPWLHLLGISYSATFNALEFPATVIPVFWNSKGVPVGVQVLGARHSDHMTLAAGKIIEDAYGGWRPAAI